MRFARLRGAARRVVRGDRTGRVRATWRILVPLLVGVATFAVSVGTAVSTGAPMGTALVVGWTATAVVVLGAVYGTARRMDRRPLREYGYRISAGWWFDFLAGVVLGGVVVVAALLFAYGLGATGRPDGPVVAAASPLRLGLFFVGFGCVAFWEELVFRGIFLTDGVEGLRERGVSPRGAVAVALLVSATVFALVHVPGGVTEGHPPWLTVLWTVPFGLLVGVAYVLTGELALPIGLHLGINFVSGNVLGVAGVATLPGVPTVLVVETAGPGLTDPTTGIPFVAAAGVGCLLVAGWCYWRRSLAARIAPVRDGRESERDAPS